MINVASVVIESFRMTGREYDTENLLAIAAENFGGMKNPALAESWLRCNLRARPRMNYFVARIWGRIIGYILWVEHGGFRPEAFIELEQMAVREKFGEEELRGKGIGSLLITSSLASLKQQIEKSGRTLKTILVTTGSQNAAAQRLYARTLGAEVEHAVDSPYREGEVEVHMYRRF